MPKVPQGEIALGLVVHIDTDELRRIGGSHTNAERSATEDRAVRGPHYFLIVEVTAPICTAVPLFTNWTPGAERLDENKKSGLPAKWVGQSSHFSRWQHWKIPLSAVEASSEDEESTSADRRMYAVGDRAALKAILNWQSRNRAPYRAA